MKLRNTLAVICAASLGLGTSASAKNLNLQEMGAALALPVLTGEFQGNFLKDTDDDDIFENDERVVTLATVTNGKDDDILLKVDVISGDTEDTTSGSGDASEPQGDNWQSESFECLLTANETTTFVFMPREAERNSSPSDENDPRDSEVYVECSTDGDPEGEPRALFLETESGILFIAVADPESGEVVSEDVIFGDAIVVDYGQGQAVSFNAITFQAGSGLNDGNKIYQFDGSEYTKFPSVLASNFIAPRPLSGSGAASGTHNETELILFTLDGTTGNIPTPRVRLTGFAYNDDEQMFDFSYEFDCFDIVQLNEINANFKFDPANPSLGLGSWSGHVRLYPQIIGVGGPDAHDAQYGDGNGIRRRAVHGWIIGNFEGDGIVVPADNPIDGTPEIDLDESGDKAAYGRPLNMSTTSIIPFMGDDDATLDADTRN